MASEAISSAIMIIGAAVGAAVLIAAILPAIFSAGDTFGTVSYSAEKKLKTDFQIVNTFSDDVTPKVWMKNIGAERISEYDLKKSDIFFGVDNTIYVCTYDATLVPEKTFNYELTGDADNGYWDIGETVEITIKPASSPSIDSGDLLYFSFSLPNSVRRTTTFSTTQF